MSINSLIPLQVRVPQVDPANAMLQGAAVAQMPTRNALLQAETELRQAQAQAFPMQAQARADEAAIKKRVFDAQYQQMQGAYALDTARAMRNAPEENRAQIAEMRTIEGRKMGLMSEADTFSDDDMTDAGLDTYIQAMSGAFEKQGQQSMPAEFMAQHLKLLAAGYEPGSEGYQRGMAVGAGISPRATGSANITVATTPGLTDAVAGSESTIEGAKAGAAETAKLEAQRDLKPEVDAAVRDAVLAVEAKADATAKQRANDLAWETYSVGMQDLINALAGTNVSGPWLGWTPSLTANDQVADGMVAIMAPLMKAAFRQSGEGTFTDRDQQLLTEMLPTRSDSKEARVRKSVNLDKVMRAKLGRTGEANIAILSKDDREAFNALQIGDRYIVDGYIYTKAKRNAD